MKHVERSYCDSGLKTGFFAADSNFFLQLSAYGNGEIGFVDFSVWIAGVLYEAIAQSDRMSSADILVCDLTINDEQVIGILKCNNRVGFTHQVMQGDTGIQNSIINHYAILPGLSQKLDEYAFIGMDSAEIRVVDKKCCIDGQETLILSEKLLQCSSRISPKDTIRKVTSITRQVAESHGENTAIAVSKAKTLMIGNAEVSDYLDPVEVGQDVFAGSPLMQEEYRQAALQAGLSGPVKIDRNLAVRTGRTHRIKTDTGIEITIPVDYFDNREYVEFINHPDGTLSISLKNIGKLLDK